MKIPRSALVLGGFVIALSGIVFTLQGLSVVGPPSSFMYNNPVWVVYGPAIAVMGIVLLGVSIIAGRK